MKILALGLLLLFMIGLTYPQEIKLEIGFVLPQSYIEQRRRASFGELVFDETKTHPAYSRPYLEEKVDGFSYLIAYDEQTREITYIHTSDKNFKTEDGLKVGVCVSYTDEQMQGNASWELRGAQTKDGWYPVLSIDSYSQKQLGKKDCMVITGFSRGGE